MKKSAEYSRACSRLVVLGLAALFVALPGSLMADDKPAPKPAPKSAPTKAAPAAAQKAAPAAAAGAVGHGVPGVAGHSNTPVHPGASTPGGAPGRPTTAGTPPTGGRQFGNGANNVGGRPAMAGGHTTGGPVNHPGLGGGRQPGRTIPTRQYGDHTTFRRPGGRATYARQMPDGRRVYADGRGRGHIEREYMYGGHRVYQRVYYVNGVAYPRYYNPYVYGGVELAVYAPARYYAPAFYGYAYNPWAVPVRYSFGFAAAPWYGVYGGYFSPYPVYAGPGYWLTDYMIGQSLAASYAAQQGQMQQQAFAAPLTPDVKNQIAEEVRRQIALENSEVAQAQNGMPDPASSGIARMLTDRATHVFVVSSPVTVTSLSGPCPMTEGDVLQLNPQQPNGEWATVVVLASKGQSCPRGAAVTVGIADLQDMQNHMRQTIDEGLGKLQASQGQGGLPPLPPSAAAAPFVSSYAQAAPAPDPAGQQLVNQEWDAGSTAEQQAVNQSMPDAAPITTPIGQPAPIAAPAAPQADPVSVSPGQTADEVTASMGKPTLVLGPPNKQIWVYKSLNVKVTFENGKVKSIE